MTWRRKIDALAGLAALVAFSGVGCTISPSPVLATTAGISGNSATSGVIGSLPDGSYEMDSATVARYNSLIAQGFGKQFEVPLRKNDGVKPLPDGNFSMDAEHVVDFGVMNAAFKQGQKP